MLDRDLADYGGPFVDERVVKNPQSQVSADFYNRQSEDAAQGTRVVYRAIVSFTTTTTAATTTVADNRVNVWSVWGTGSAQKPVVTKTATGKYTLTFAASFTDALGVVESVDFEVGHADILHSSDTWAGSKLAAISSNIVDVKVYDNSLALSDLTGTAVVTVWLR